jgi:DUF4097 and DUF4098 domain-containing protein YvlB
MSEERLQILKMLQEGKITAEEAAQLLEALKASEAASSNDNSQVQAVWQTPTNARWMRIEVKERNGDRVHIKLPLAVVKAALRVGGHFSMGGFDSDELGPDVMAELEQALMEGETGMLIDVVEEDGDHVQIFLE